MLHVLTDTDMADTVPDTTELDTDMVDTSSESARLRPSQKLKLNSLPAHMDMELTPLTDTQPMLTTDLSTTTLMDTPVPT